MRNRKYSTVIIGGVDYWEHFRFPFVLQKTLDESLDFAVVELHHMTRKDPFKPFTTATIGEGETAMSFVVASDEVEEIYGTGRYKHTVTVMEKTKETERIMCGAKAFTNPLVRDYTDGQTKPYYLFLPKIGDFEWFEYPIPDGGFEPELMKDGSFSSPIIKGALKFYSFSSFIDFDKHISISPGTDLVKGDVKIYYNKNTTALAYEDTKTKGVVKFVPKADSVLVAERNDIGMYDTFDITDSREGVYTIIGLLKMANGTPKYGVLFDIISVSDPVVKEPYTVKEVVEYLLDTAETLRAGDEPRYRLKIKDGQAASFSQAAPEFRFSNGRSLWENLREVGQFIHAIPRAIHDLTDGKDYIVFDDLGGVARADLSKGDRYGGGASLSVGDYTAGLEAMASNLVNLDDVADGSITEPFDGGYQSLRAATEEARITEGTGIIKTTHPIEKIIKVEVGEFTVDGKTYSGGDITPYIFPKTEYDILSSFSGTYPTSKTYALYYNQGAPNIEGLWYKAQDEATDLWNSMEQYSIVNIIELAVGVNIGYFESIKKRFSSAEYKSKWFDYNKLVFRVTYVPSVTARVRQYNPVFDGDFPAMLAHNQSANKLSAKAFGENLRGQLAMMSKADEAVQYRFRRPEDIPEPGMLYDDDRYISSVTARVYHDFVLAQLNLSAGYNEMGARVEIHNAIRQFEIPAAEDRYTTLEEFVVIGKQDTDDNGLAMNDAMKSAILAAFADYKDTKDITLSLATTKDKQGEAITAKPVALPVVSLAIGTSLYFGFCFESNFAAGSKSSAGGEAFRSQEYVPYGDDYYSHAETIGFDLLAKPSQPAPALDSAHDLPEGAGIGGTVMVSTGIKPILWHKDSADAGCLAYQVHYLTNDDLIIGDGLAYACPAVRKTPAEGRARVYFFKRRINQLTGTTDTTDAIGANGFHGYDLVFDGNCIKGVTAPIGAVSWAIIKGGRFLLGKNSTRMDDIYFNFKRRLT